MSSSKKLFKIYTKDNPNGLGGNVFAYVMQSKRFTHMENDSIVYNQNDLQIWGRSRKHEITARCCRMSL